MDITFITMHDLSPDANVLYASESIGDVLGYQASDVTGNSCFEYFHPDETPFATGVHRRAVHLDRAAMLSYCNLKRKDGRYVRCECVFTVVYNVVVACTSLYRYTDKSHGRAIAAPAIRRAFASSERDPRYHMLTHLSSKFSAQPQDNHEPRAAIILNRFTRTLTIMYATHALSDILGIPAEDAIGKSFYECISEECLQGAVDVLERAKENDSIAYLRFHWRDPRNVRARNEPRSPNARPGDSDGVSSASTGGSVDAGVPPDGPAEGPGASERGSSDDEDAATPRRDSTPQSSVSGNAGVKEHIDVEAVVSCTSDGLVVILRKARGPPPASPVFAAPWSHTPLMPERPRVASGPFAADFMDSIRQVAVFAWSLRSINGDIMTHALPGRPNPDAAEVVGDFVKPGSSHWKRAREWEEAIEKGDGEDGRVKDPQYPDTGKDSDETQSNKRRARGD